MIYPHKKSHDNFSGPLILPSNAELDEELARPASCSFRLHPIKNDLKESGFFFLEDSLPQNFRVSYANATTISEVRQDAILVLLAVRNLNACSISDLCPLVRDVLNVGRIRTNYCLGEEYPVYHSRTYLL
jgi:hypothetical protein